MASEAETNDMSGATQKKRRTVRQVQHAGKLTAQQADEGITAASQNTIRLAADARLLFDNGRYPSAQALAILAIEEYGKIPILHGITAASESELKSAWKNYRDHKEKNAWWPLVFDFLSGAIRAADEIEDVFDPKAEHPQLLEDLKQMSLYSDCFENCVWWIPGTLEDAELTHWLVAAAEHLARTPVLTTTKLAETKSSKP